MKKTLSLILAVIVLVCAVCVFVPTGTASASETDGLGVWLFNYSVSDSWYDYTFSANFVSANQSFISLRVNDIGRIYYFWGTEQSHRHEVGDGGSFYSEWRTIIVTSFSDSEFPWFLRENAVYQGAVSSAPPAPTTYNVALDVTNGQVFGNDSVEAEKAYSYKIVPNSGYGYPTSITCTGATLQSYDSTTGEFTLSNATADVSVSGVCSALPVVTSYSVSFDVSFGRIFGDSSIDNTQTKTYTLVPNNGYGLPDTVTVSGATLQSYDKSTGELVITNPTANVILSGQCPVMAVDPNSASYNAGYNAGMNAAYDTLANTLLSSNENVGQVSIVAYDSSGNSIVGTHWDVDFNYTYNSEQYLQLYNISVGSTNVDHYVVTLYFSNGQSFVPMSVRSSTGFTSSGNNTAPLKPVSYYGNGLYGSDFDSLGSAPSFELTIPAKQTSVTLRLLGNSYGNNLNSVYDKGVKDGFLQGEKVGYNKGKADGVRDSKEYTFFNLVAAVIDVPINAILSLFNLEIFGVNLAPLLTAILSLCVVLAIVKMIL